MSSVSACLLANGMMWPHALHVQPFPEVHLELGGRLNDPSASSESHGVDPPEISRGQRDGQECGVPRQAEDVWPSQGPQQEQKRTRPGQDEGEVVLFPLKSEVDEGRLADVGDSHHAEHVTCFGPPAAASLGVAVARVEVERVDDGLGQEMVERGGDVSLDDKEEDFFQRNVEQRVASHAGRWVTPDVVSDQERVPRCGRHHCDL